MKKMPVTIHDEILQGSDAWQQLRKDRYTGSNADKLLKFGTIQYAKNSDNNFWGNFHTQRGHILEDSAIEIYSQINKRTVNRPGFVTNDRFPTCGYSPDGIDGSILLEVKCFIEAKHMAIFGGNIPFKVLAQIYFGLLITECDEARLIIYNPDLEVKWCYKSIVIKRNRNVNQNFKRILNREKVVA